MINTDLQKPCIVQTTQGFSVSYSNKLLYSKYNPSRLILQKIQSLKLLPDTLILAFSPVLSYGLQELSSLLPQNCLILGCEFTQELYNFEKEHLEPVKNFMLISPENLYILPQLINTKTIPGIYKRILAVDFSAGVTFAQGKYVELEKACINAVRTYWGNRITLTRFGRKYSKNFFTNLQNISSTVPVENYFKRITRPVIVCGAGESLDKDIAFIKENRNNFYIIAVDTALTALISYQIEPDSVFLEEAQPVILKAFTGTKKHNYHVFQSLSSIPLHFIPESRKSFFTTEYADCTFIKNLQEQKQLPAANKPLGSVGLTAFYYALRFRANENISVFLTGLDFSYTAGRTHALNTPSHKNLLIKLNRINSLYNLGACYNFPAFQHPENNTAFTIPVMQSYSTLFNSLFCNEKNCFTSENLLIPLCFPKASLQKLSDNFNSNNITESSAAAPLVFSEEYEKALKKYFEQEKEALLQIKDILTGKMLLQKEISSQKLQELIQDREYLYLHFPDGTQYRGELDFLKRISVEIDFFLKIFR